MTHPDTVVAKDFPSNGPSVLAAARDAGVPREMAMPASDLADAVRRARAAATDGSVVLLSPAAPSYDNYVNFEERGDRFSELAREPAAA